MEPSNAEGTDVVNRSQVLSEAVQHILGVDYTSECSACDGSECDGSCKDVANIDDLEDSPTGTAGVQGPTQTDSSAPRFDTPPFPQIPSRNAQGNGPIPKLVARTGPEHDDFSKIIDEANEYNRHYLKNMPWPPPPHLDPFNLFDRQHSDPDHPFSADGQWEVLKATARSQGAEQPHGATDTTQARHDNGYCAISTQPNTLQQFNVGMVDYTGTTSQRNTHPRPDGPGESLPGRRCRESRIRDIQARLGRDWTSTLEALGITTDEILDTLIMECEVPDDDGEAMHVEWVDVDLEVALYSGCCDHVMDVETHC